MANGIKADYQCRRCGETRLATWRETDPSILGRVVCYACGGTCDPTPQELKRIFACQERQSIQTMHHVSAAIGSHFDNLQTKKKEPPHA